MNTPHSTQSLFSSYRHFEEFQDGREYVRGYFGGLAGLNVLDAGCGSASWLFDLSRCHVTGIDASAKQLGRNKLLETAVCADLEDYENEGWLSHFDLVLCLDVLEHLKNPARVVGKLISWMKPGASLVLAYPNPQSLKGRVTKYSPHILHRLFYRMSIGTPLGEAGEDRGPFNTILSPDIELLNLARLLVENSLAIDLLVSIESYQNKLAKRYLSTRVVNRLNKILLGDLRVFLDPSATDFIIVASRIDC